MQYLHMSLPKDLGISEYFCSLLIARHFCLPLQAQPLLGLELENGG